MPPPRSGSVLLVPTVSIALWWRSLTQSRGQLCKPQGIQKGVKGVEKGRCGGAGGGEKEGEG